MDKAESSPGDLDRVAEMVAQLFASLETRRKLARNVREQVPALESTWSSIERDVLSLGRRRRSLEAPLAPLPEPRGGAAMQNWLEQRMVQGARTRAWVERLPSALALMRSVAPFDAFGVSCSLPAGDERTAEALRSQMRQAILRQDVAAMDATLQQIQAALTRDGQRRTDLLRIVESRVGHLLPSLIGLAARDAAGAPGLQRWQRDVNAQTATLKDAFARWDVDGGRAAEKGLNALVDELPGLRDQVEREAQSVSNSLAARDQDVREQQVRRSGLTTNSGDPMSFGRRVAAGGGGTFGVLGALMGFAAVAVVLATGLAARWYGVVALSSPVLLAAAGFGFSASLGADRLRQQASDAQMRAALLDRKIASDAEAIVEMRRRVEDLRRILEWCRLPA